MSNIDNRVVKMDLENRAFEKNAKESMKTISDLKKSLDFSGSAKGLNELEAASRDFRMGGLGNAVDQVKVKFSALEIAGITALVNITNQAVNTGKRLISSLTVDNISAGWQKYADKTSAVQTIMAATREQFEDTGKQMEYVNKQLDRLNWFTDETSYNFVDMVSNIGKFTSNNVKLDDAASAMQGIATWAAVSGANAQSASHVMYNLAQAIGSGSVKLLDWRSVETMNMSTVEFKKNAIETAVALGTLKKTGDGLYETLEGNELSVVKFNDALKDGWFTSDVLIKTLDKYGGFSVQLGKEMETLGDYFLTSEILQYIEDVNNGIFNLAEEASSHGADFQQLNDAIWRLRQPIYELGRRAFAASQEAKTFQEAIDSVKDAASTGWAKTFELIFGDYQKAKVVWTGLSELLYEVFVEGINTRNRLLANWSQNGGQDALMNGLGNILQHIIDLLDTIKSAWRNVFPEKTASQLVAMTRIFERFTEGLALTDNEASGLERVLTVLFGVIRVGWNVFKDILQVGGAILSWVVDLARSLLDLAGGSDKAADSVSDFAKKVRKFSVLKSLRKVIDVVAGALNTAKDAIVEFVGSASQLDSAKQLASNFLYLVDAVKQFASIAWDWIAEKISAIGKVDLKKPKDGMTVLTTIADNLFKALNKLFDIFKNLGESFSKWFKQLTEPKEGEQAESIFTKISDSADEMYKNVADSATGSIKQYILTGFTNLGATLEEAAKNINFGKVFSILKSGVMTYFVFQLAQLTKTVKGGISQPITSLQDITKAFKGVLSNLAGTIKEYGKNLRAGTILKLAGAIGILAAALIGLSFIPADRLSNASVAMLILAGVLALIMKAYDRIASVRAAQSVASMADAVDMIKTSITGFLDSIAKTAKAIAAAFSVALVLLSIAAAVTVMVVAIKSLTKAIMSGTDSDALGLAVISIIGIIISLGTAVALMSKVNAGALLGAASAIFAIGISVNLIVKALSSLQKAAGKEDYGKTFWSIVGIMEAMAVAVRIAGRSKGATGAFIGMSIAIGIIGAVIKNLAESTGDVAGAAKAVRSIMMLMGALALASTAVDPVQMKAMSKGLMSMALSLGVIMVSLLAFGKNAERGAKGIKLLAGALGVLVIAGIAINALGLAPAMFAMSAAFNAFGATALKIGAMFALIGVGVNLLAKGFGAFGPALDKFVTGWITATQKIQQNADVLKAGMGSFIEIIITGIISKIEMITTVGGMLLTALAKGILLAGPALVQTAVEIILKFINAVSNTVGMITNALFNLLVNAINALADSIRSYGGALLAAIGNVVSAILELILRALATLVEGIPGIGDTLGGWFRKGAEELETGAKELPEKLGVIPSEIDSKTNEVTNAMMEDGVKIKDAGDNMIETGFGNLGPKAKEMLASQGVDVDGLFSEQFNNGMPKTEAAIDGAASSITNKLSGVTDAFAVTGEKAPDELASGIFAGVSKAKDAATELGTETISAVETAAGGGGRIGGKLVDETASGIRANKSKAVNMAGSVGLDVANALNKKDSAYQSGDFTIQGFINGVKARRREAAEAAADVANNAVYHMRNTLQEQSPSKVTTEIGDFGTIGFINGLLNRKKEAGFAGAEVAQSSVDMMNATILSAMDIMSNTSEFQPTIRPVMDLTSISQGASAISSMLGGNRAMALGASVRIGAFDETRYSEFAAMMNKRDMDIQREFSSLNDNIRELVAKIDNLELRMDGDDVVAGLSGKFNRSIGRVAAMKQRGM